MLQPDWDFALWAVLAALATLGFWADRTRLGRNVSGLAVALVTAMLLSNLGLVPKSAPAYGVVWAYLVPIAIPLLLLKANLRHILKETRGLLAPFLLGAAGTVAGALLGAWLLPLGEHAPKLAGVFSATYIGGSMNMAAVSRAVELEPALATASVAADNVVGVTYFALLALAPSLVFLRRWFREGDARSAEATAAASAAPAPLPTRLDPVHLGVALALAFTLCALGETLATWAGVGAYSILFVTALAVLVANLFPRQLARLQGDFELGQFFMYLFFAAIGLSADVAAMIQSTPVVAAYAAFIVACHVLVVFSAGRWLRCGLMDAVIASNACVGGPASAAAMAAGKGRPDLVAPAVLLGVLGYAIANFIGIGLASWLAS